MEVSRYCVLRILSTFQNRVIIGYEWKAAISGKINGDLNERPTIVTEMGDQGQKSEYRFWTQVKAIRPQRNPVIGTAL